MFASIICNINRLVYINQAFSGFLSTKCHQHTAFPCIEMGSLSVFRIKDLFDMDVKIRCSPIGEHRILLQYVIN